MDPIRRWLSPPLATAVITLIVAAQVAAVLGVSISYARQTRRIAELEDALCRERLVRFSHLVSGVPCPDAQNVLAQVLPQRWMPIAQSSSGERLGARVVGWRPPRRSAPSLEEDVPQHAAARQHPQRGKAEQNGRDDRERL